MQHTLKMTMLSLTIGIMLALCITLIYHAGQLEAEGQVEILLTPGHSASPSPAPLGTPIILTISPVSIKAPHHGSQVAVYDPKNLSALPPLVLPSSCSSPNPSLLPSPAGIGKKWELRADIDGDGDFTDLGGFLRVNYTLPDPGTITMPDFGSGGFATIALIPGATVSPSAPLGGYAWQDVDLVGPGTFGSDNTFTLGTYTFVSCGREGSLDPNSGDPYLGTATFQIIKANSSITTQSQPSSKIAPSTKVTDKATVAVPAGLPAPTGTVSFFLCDPSTTLPDCSNGGTPVLPPKLLPPIPPFEVTSSPIFPTAIGFYCWRAEYSGDTNYNPSNHTNGIIGQRGECFQVVRDGTIIIKKNTVPQGPQDFSFTHNITSKPAVPSPFKLDDDSNPTLSNTKTFLEVPAGSYRVTETTVLSIPLQSIVCIDPTGDSFRSGNSANIELDAGETVTCTFTNGKEVPSCETGRLPEQPKDAISMTSIRSNSIVKTIHAEKQVFNCQLPQGSIPVIADVTIIAEIYQDINTKTILSKQVEVVTCIKDPARIRVLECNLSIPSTDRVPVTNCEELPMQHPQEMNTITKGSTAKTIDTLKEVFTCTMNTPNDLTDDKKVDLVLFTEIYQNLNTLESPDLTMLSMKCVIKIDTVLVESCQFRQVNS